jgi:hypothetical protein
MTDIFELQKVKLDQLTKEMAVIMNDGISDQARLKAFVNAKDIFDQPTHPELVG